MSLARDPSQFHPQEAREQFRKNHMTHITCGKFCAGYIQANIACLPSAMADDFERFCHDNSATFPHLYRSRPGEVSAPPLAFNSGCDVRTDLPLYCISEHGVVTKHTTDVTEIPWDDMVTFYFGCSYSFDHVLNAANVSARHVTENQDVPTYVTNINFLPRGPFSGGMTVTMRAFPREFVQKVAELSVPLYFAHGGPVHIGDPTIIGIEDYLHPATVQSPIIREGDVLMFWGCGTSATEAIVAAKPRVAVSLSQSCMGSVFITDQRVTEYYKDHPFKYRNLVPKVIFLSESPQFASLASQQAIDQIANIRNTFEVDNLKTEASTNGISDNKDDQSFLKSAMALSHASSVAIVTWGVSEKQLAASVCIAKALLAQDKEVCFLASETDVSELEKFLSKCEATGVLAKHVSVASLGTPLPRDTCSTLHIVARCLGPRFSAIKLNGVAIVDQDGKITIKSLLSLQEETGDVITGKQGHVAKNGQSLAQPGLVSSAVAMATFILHSCPIHSRYLRRGRGEHSAKHANEFSITSKQFESLGIAAPDIDPWMSLNITLRDRDSLLFLRRDEREPLRTTARFPIVHARSITAYTSCKTFGKTTVSCK